MDGIVSLLDDGHSLEVRELWDELERDFGLLGVRVTPFPHFSYHVAERCDPDRLSPALEQVARQFSPFSVQATGLGVFAGAEPVLYIPLVRGTELGRLHQAVWEAVSAAAEGSPSYYEPRQWLPHITLACGDLDQENLGLIMTRLGGRNIAWEIMVDNLTLVTTSGQLRVVRHDLTGQSGEPSRSSP